MRGRRQHQVEVEPVDEEGSPELDGTVRRADLDRYDGRLARADLEAGRCETRPGTPDIGPRSIAQARLPHDDSKGGFDARHTGRRRRRRGPGRPSENCPTSARAAPAPAGGSDGRFAPPPHWPATPTP